MKVNYFPSFVSPCLFLLPLGCVGSLPSLSGGLPVLALSFQLSCLFLLHLQVLPCLVITSFLLILASLSRPLPAHTSIALAVLLVVAVGSSFISLINTFFVLKQVCPSFTSFNSAMVRKVLLFGILLVGPLTLFINFI